MRIVLFILIGIMLNYVYNLLLKVFNLTRSNRCNSKEYNRSLEDMLKHSIVILSLFVIGLIILLVGSIFKIFVLGGM